MHRLEELVRLLRMGTGQREAARLLGMSPNTERQYRRALGAEGLLVGPADRLPPLEELRAAVLKHMEQHAVPEQQRSQLAEWEVEIEALRKKGLGPRAIYDRLRIEVPVGTERRFCGSYWQVKRLCRALRRKQGVRAEDVAIPVETAAGEVAQVDFGYVGRLFDPQMQKLRQAYCFVMVLGYSRKMVARVVFDQRTETWLQLHAEAFAELGGVIETVVPDNLKAAVIRAAFSSDGLSELNRSYREVAKHYGFKVDPTPPYDAPKKGKVESGVKYVKRNFFVGREGQNVEEVRQALVTWVEKVADAREHGTTHKLPGEVFEDLERSALRPLPTRPFEMVVWKLATVHQDTHACFEHRLYSVPWRLMGQQVWLRATARTVCAYADDTRVATHDRNGPGPRSTQAEHLPEHREDLRHRSPGYWLERASKMGPTVGDYIAAVFASDPVLSMLRTAQSMVRHLETFPVDRAERACKRAHFYESHTYGALKRILREGLDLEPLPTGPLLPAAMASNVKAGSVALKAPRFARTISELWHLPDEGTDEPN